MDVAAMAEQIGTVVPSNIHYSRHNHGWLSATAVRTWTLTELLKKTGFKVRAKS